MNSLNNTKFLCILIAFATCFQHVANANQIHTYDMNSTTKDITCLSEKDKARFWDKVNKQGALPDQSNPHYAGLDRCWEWTGYSHIRGYGRIRIKSHLMLAHRVCYFLSNGSIDSNLCVCHRCDNTSCVNPSHLFCATHSINMIDKSEKGRHNMPSGDLHYFRLRPDSRPRGEKNSMSKLTDSDVREIRRLREVDGISHKEISAMFGLSKSSVYRVFNRKSWGHIA